MIQFGITRLEDIPENAREPEKDTHVSLALLGEISGEMTPRNEQLLEFLGVATPSGFHQVQRRRTYGGRYLEIDLALQKILKTHFDENQFIRIHEVAGSNGICGLETYNLLSQDHKVSVHSSDYHTCLYQISVPKSGWTVIIDDKERPLQFVGKSMVIWISAKERARHPINRLLKFWLKRRLLPKALKIFRSSSPDANPLVETISLFHPYCVEKARSDPNFTVGYADMFDLPAQSFEVVRVMSALTGIDPEKVNKGMKILVNSVVDRGILVIGIQKGRASNEINCSFFSRTGNKMTHIMDIGAGAEEKSMILDLEL